MCWLTGAELTEETQLVLFGLNEHVSKGPCTAAKPWSWNALESAKWTSWSGLGEMAPVEAMRLYVRTLEEDVVCPPLPPSIVCTL